MGKKINWLRIIINAILSLIQNPKEKVKDAVIDAASDEINKGGDKK